VITIGDRQINDFCLTFVFSLTFDDFFWTKGVNNIIKGPTTTNSSSRPVAVAAAAIAAVLVVTKD